MPAPETVTEAVAFLAREGYRADLRDLGPEAGAAGVGPGEGRDGLVVDYTFRFEGPSDPGDEAIVMGVRSPATGAKGVLVAAFGPSVDPEQGEMLRRLASAPG